MGKSRQLLLSATSAVAFLVAGITGACADKGYSWSGYYFGLHAGAAQSDTDWTLTQGAPVATLSQKDEAFIGGAQVGLQKQFGNVVAGIEVSWSGTKLSKDGDPIIALDVGGSEIDQMVLVTGRLGYAVGRSLVYVKGGWATATVELTASHTLGGPLHGSSKDWYDGWTLGGGYEYALTSAVSLGLEYNYVRIDIDNHALKEGPFLCPACFADGKSDIQNVTARLNFKFN